MATSRDDLDRSNSLEDHSTELTFPSYDYGSTAITIQPLLSQGDRRPIPVLTSGHNNNISQFIPMHGLDFLSTAELLYVQQSVELEELLAHTDSENRYTVKVPQGETLYYASETSSAFERTCFGPSRSFTMKLFDKTQQEALELRRRLACGMCPFWCYLQLMEVRNPTNGEFIGTIEQRISFSKPIFFICNRERDALYRIEGPQTYGCISFGKDMHFKIFTSDGFTQVGSINRQWDQVQLTYNLCVQLPSQSIDTKRKALILGAGFLLEYMYFSKTTGCKCSC